MGGNFRNVDFSLGHAARNAQNRRAQHFLRAVDMRLKKGKFVGTCCNFSERCPKWAHCKGTYTFFYKKLRTGDSPTEFVQKTEIKKLLTQGNLALVGSSFL